MTTIENESLKPRARRVGAGMILIITLTFLIGAFIRDCGFFPGKGAAGGTDREGEPSAPAAVATRGDLAGHPDVGGSGSGSASGSGAGGVGEGGTLTIELRGDRIFRDGSELGLDQLEQLARELATRERGSIALVLDASTVTFGFVDRVERRLDASGVVWRRRSRDE